jgi:hypothetical protein
MTDHDWLEVDRTGCCVDAACERCTLRAEFPTQEGPSYCFPVTGEVFDHPPPPCNDLVIRSVIDS